MSGDLIGSIASGFAGGSLALIGQFLAQRGASTRHQAELNARSVEVVASLSTPAAGRRAEALETLYAILQQTIDDRSVSEELYVEVRRLLIYPPPDVQHIMVRALLELIRARRANDDQRSQAAVQDLKTAQAALRRAAGLDTIESLFDGRTGE